jgi:bifunctional non-homologous end joining protein LigD
MENEIRIGGHSIELTHTDKILFPEDGLTKGDLIDYYRKIAPVMLPYLADRPLVMHRFPEGIHSEGFIQQKISDYFPDWVERVAVAKEGGNISHVVCQNAATLIYLANQACVTLHVWLSRQDLLRNPDQLIFDLDPPGKDFGAVREAALILRKLFNQLDLEPLVKTTGSSGLHIVIPLDRSATFEEVRGFARGMAEYLSAGGSVFTAEQRKDKRNGRVLLDYARNSYGQTVVAPYAVRARPGAPIAAPLDWDEVSDSKLSSQSYSIKNIFQRLDRSNDPWKGLWRKGHSLEKIRKKLESWKKAGAKLS